MARTRKAIQPLDLYKYDVLIEDRGPRSDYFKISQFDGYFYGGRNAFLIAGAGVFRPNSKILIEILNKNGTTVYSVPVRDFLEGNSRLVQVEVYSDTPIGPGKIVVLGSVDSYIDGRAIPDEWKGKYNVRWVTDVIISPLVENKTPIRFNRNPQIQVSEKFYTAPSSSVFSQSVVVPVDIQLSAKYFNVYPNGYLIDVVGPTNSTRLFNEYVGGVLTGSLLLPKQNEQINISLPITKIYNDKVAVSDGTLLYSNNNNLVLSGFISSSGSYIGEITPFGNTEITSSLNVQFNELIVEKTGSNFSFAQIRLTDLNTVSGEVYKTRVSYKNTTSPSNFTLLADVDLQVSELLVTDSGSSVIETGRFSDIVLNDYWYAATMSVSRTDHTSQLPTYYYTSSLIAGDSLYLKQCCTDLLDSINATPPIVNGDYEDGVSYFIGSRNTNNVSLAPRTEYTLQFEAFAAKTSASVEWIGADPTLEVYIVPAENSDINLIDSSNKGQLLGVLTPEPKFLRQNFETVQFNFTPNILNIGNFSLRFIVYGAFWSIANVSIKPATERFFSPDEVTLLVPNNFTYNDYLTFQVEYLDINNNSINVKTTSLPTYFTGSEIKTDIVTIPNFAPTSPLTGSIYFSGGFLYVYNGLKYVSASLS